MHRVRITGERPDFRVFIGLLYSDMHNVDTDGNSFVVQTRDWTSLYVKDRESDDPCVEIEQAVDKAYFEVESDSERLEQLAAIYLLEYCGDLVEHDGRPLSESEVASLRERFESELKRGRSSIWHQSSEETPYPNLKAE